MCYTPLMAYLGYEIWVPVITAGLLCGIVRGVTLKRSGEAGKVSLLRRFLSSYDSVPVVSALIGLSVFLVMITIDNLVTQRGDDLEGVSYLLAVAIIMGIPFFLGLLAGIPLAALTCWLITQARGIPTGNYVA